MNNKLYTLEELQEALSKNQDGDDSALEHLIDQVFEDYEPSTFHDMYVEEFATNQYESHQECYSQFKLMLLNKFLEPINTTKPQYRSFFENESVRPYKNLEDWGMYALALFTLLPLSYFFLFIFYWLIK